MPDIKITVIDREGKSHEIDAPTDMSMNLMELVKSYELAEEGTFGTCGGMLMCASCNCYTLKNADNLPPMGDEEEALLHSDGFNVKETSRLSCQLPITEGMEGLVIEIAKEY